MPRYDWTIYSLITLGGGLASLLTSGLLWRRRADYAARWLALLCLSSAWWGVLTSLEFAATSLELSLMWGKGSYVGIVVSPPLFVLFALAYARQYRPKPALARALFVPGILALLGVATNSLHHLHWTRTAIDPATHLIAYDRGPLFVVFVITTYLLNGSAFMLLLTSVVQSQRYYAGQRVSVLLAALIPLAVNVGYLVGSTPIPDMDWTPMSFAATCVILAIGMRKQQLFDLLPVLRTRLLDTMGGAVVLVDEKGRIADYNRAMVSVAPEIEDSVGMPCIELLPNQYDLCAALKAGHEVNQLVQMRVGGEERVFDVRTRPLTYASGRDRGHLAVLYDITAEHRLQVERDGLLSDLRTALVSVEELGSLIPICSHCKKIRDDQGFWHNVEVFLAERQPVELSEATCPDCQAKFESAAGEPRSARSAGPA